MNEHDFTRIVGCMECTTYEIIIWTRPINGPKFLWIKGGGARGEEKLKRHLRLIKCYMH